MPSPLRVAAAALLVAACHPAPPPAPAAGAPPRAGAAALEWKGDEQVRAALDVAPAAVAPGGRVEARVRFRVAPGWHIYAEDPGESGLPTRVQLTAPPGFQVGATRYPPAETFTSPGPVRSFGYEREAVLAVTVEAPAQLEDRAVVLRARASWLACRESCVPGRAELQVTLPVRVQPPG